VGNFKILNAVFLSNGDPAVKLVEIKAVFTSPQLYVNKLNSSALTSNGGIERWSKHGSQYHIDTALRGSPHKVTDS